MVDPINDRNMREMARFVNQCLALFFVVIFAVLIGSGTFLITRQITHQPTEETHG